MASAHKHSEVPVDWNHVMSQECPVHNLGCHKKELYFKTFVGNFLKIFNCYFNNVIKMFKCENSVTHFPTKQIF